MIGYFKNNRYENLYGNPIKCFKCGENECVDSASFPLQHGGNGELLYCSNHKEDAFKEISERSYSVTVINNNVASKTN